MDCERALPIVLITGVRGGIGLEYSKYLASNYRANLMLAGRSHERMQPIANEVDSHQCHPYMRTVGEHLGLRELVKRLSSEQSWCRRQLRVRVRRNNGIAAWGENRIFAPNFIPTIESQRVPSGLGTSNPEHRIGWVSSKNDTLGDGTGRVEILPTFLIMLRSLVRFQLAPPLNFQAKAGFLPWD